MEKHIPQELQKTSSFGRFFFRLSLALFTIGLVGVICTIGRTLPELLDACFIGGVFFLPALVCWYIGFRHDRPKVEKFYKQKQRPNDP